MEEIWKDIYYFDKRTNKTIDYRGFYQVSNRGRIKSLARDTYYKRGNNSIGIVKHVDEMILLPRLAGKKNTKYYRVSLNKPGSSKKQIFVHIAVAYMFVPNPDNKQQVDHIDGNCQNNAAANLRWVTQFENVNNPNTVEKREARKVIQFNKDGSVVKEWRSVVTAGRALGISYNAIYQCVAGRLKTYKGFIWQYAS